jgi:hypothetical protein
MATGMPQTVAAACKNAVVTAARTQFVHIEVLLIKSFDQMNS